MEPTLATILPVILLILCAGGLTVGLLIAARVVNPDRPGTVKQSPYESGMDPVHDARRRFDVRFHLLAIAFLVFDVELLFLYPWAVISRPNADTSVAAPLLAHIDINHQTLRQSAITGNNEIPAPRFKPAVPLAFAGAMTFIALLAIGYIYDWRKGVFQWR